MKQVKRDRTPSDYVVYHQFSALSSKALNSQLGRSSDSLSAPSLPMRLSRRTVAFILGAAVFLSSQQRDCSGFPPDSLLTLNKFVLNGLFALRYNLFSDQIKCKSTTLFQYGKYFLFTAVLYLLLRSPTH